ncbi:MAG: CPBP family intramembrane metalloprotease [Spirochaetales bacterium]|nr:CPBP family intramembrane metalloprotease [Spirochaetales bacterium]
MIKNILKKVLHFLMSLLFCFAIPVMIKQFVLRPVRFNLIGDNVAGQLFQWGLSLLLILFGYIFFIRIFEKRRAAELSLGGFLQGSLKGGLWGMMSIGVIFLVLFLSEVFRITSLSGSTEMYQNVVLLFLLAATEEILYRGVLHRLIEKWTNTVIALVVSSVLFGIMHFSNDYFNVMSLISIVSGGAVMGLAYSLTKSLWIPIFAHFAWNFSQVLMGIRLSGMDEFSNLALFQSELTGKSLLTGGDFGVENSIITIVYTAAFSIILGFRLHSRRAACPDFHASNPSRTKI